MNEIPAGRLAEHIRESVHQVFNTMLNKELTPLAHHCEFSPADIYDGVMSLVGIAGGWTGTGRLLCSPDLACLLAGNLLMTEFHKVDEEVLDAIAEISNMVVGSVKTHLEDTLGPLCLSVPTVIFGKNYLTRSVMLREWLVVPFDCHGHSLEFRFSLVKTPSTPQAGFRLVMDHV
jgi:chemotaxis protein CheX